MIVKQSLGIAGLVAVIGYVSIVGQGVQAQGLLNKLENAVENGVDRIQFAEWANQHPEWVNTHHDRYEYFKHHPEEAEHSRAEWSEWHQHD
jgi:hypothetical protein